MALVAWSNHLDLRWLLRWIRIKRTPKLVDGSLFTGMKQPPFCTKRASCCFRDLSARVSVTSVSSVVHVPVAYFFEWAADLRPGVVKTLLLPTEIRVHCLMICLIFNERDHLRNFFMFWAPSLNGQLKTVKLNLILTKQQLKWIIV